MAATPTIWSCWSGMWSGSAPRSILQRLELLERRAKAPFGVRKARGERRVRRAQPRVGVLRVGDVGGLVSQREPRRPHPCALLQELACEQNEHHRAYGRRRHARDGDGRAGHDVARAPRRDARTRGALAVAGSSRV